MKIVIGADHGGFELKEKVKEFLIKKGHTVDDCGAYKFDKDDDYPDFISKAADIVSKDPENTKGIIFGRSGQAEAMLANKFRNVRCALFYAPAVPVGAADVAGRVSTDPFEMIRLTREHNNSNMLSLGGSFVKEQDLLKAVTLWLETPFPGHARHVRRIEKIKKIESKGMRVAVSFLSSVESDMKPESILQKLPHLEKAGVDTIQWDLMDGKYNGVNTAHLFNSNTIETVMNNTQLDSEAHMMVSEPWNFVDTINGFASTLIFHVEACKTREDVIKTIEKIKSLGKKVGIAIEPSTLTETLIDYLHLIDLVLVMSVKTGYAGQPFIDVSKKIEALVEKRRAKNLSFEIEVDGGINDKTIEIVRSAGCDAVNSASFILNNDYEKAVRVLKGK